MTILSICSNSIILSIIHFIKILIDIVKFFLPMILILMVSLDLVKAVASGENEFGKILKTSGTKILAAVLVFLLPTIVDLSLTLVGESQENYKSCWNNATVENIEKYRTIEEETRRKKREEQRLAAQKLREEQEAKDLANKIPNTASSSNLVPFVNGVQRALQKGECTADAGDTCLCPTNGRFSGFAFTVKTSEDPQKKNKDEMREFASYGSPDKMEIVVADCGDGTVYRKKVNAKVASNFKAALEKICELQTTGINGIKIDKKYLQVNGTFVPRLNSDRTICSPHAYGTAIDINYSLKIEVNGTSYKPYAEQGRNTKKRYDEFVQALGKEGHPLNINYVLWQYAFAPNGFNWGGNWSDNGFDPMHFEIPS